MLTLEGGAYSPFWCLCQKLSLSLLYFNKTLLHKSSAWSSLVSGPRLNSSLPEAKNPGVFHSPATTFQDTATSLLGWPKSRTLTTGNIETNMEQQELLFMAGGCMYEMVQLLGSPCVGFLGHQTYSYHTIQQLYSFAFTQRSQRTTFTQKSAHGCL